MKISLNIFKVVPSKTSSQIEKVGITDQIYEDVATFCVDDNNITIFFNETDESTLPKVEKIPLRDNDGNLNEDWRGMSIFVTRKFLEIDFSK